MAGHPPKRMTVLRGDRTTSLICQTCQVQMGECRCPDADQKLRNLTFNPDGLATKWCVGCDHHFSRCRCETPQLRLYFNGKQVDPRKVRNILGQSVADTNPEIGFDGEPN